VLGAEYELRGYDIRRFAEVKTVDHVSFVVESDEPWEDGEYYIFLWQQGASYRWGRVLLDSKDGAEAEDVLMDFEVDSMERFYADTLIYHPDWEEIDNCRHQDKRFRVELMDLIANLLDWTYPWCRLPICRQPHFFISGGEQETRAVAHLLRRTFVGRNGVALEYNQKSLLSRWAETDEWPQIRQAKVVTIRMNDLDVEITPDEMYYWRRFMKHILCNRRYKETTFILYGWEAMMQRWVEIFPKMLQSGHFIKYSYWDPDEEEHQKHVAEE
jgi:hypothetical protein